MWNVSRLGALLCFSLLFDSPAAFAQPPAGGPPGTPAAKPPVRRPSPFPERAPADPALVAKGKTTYSVNCQFCHGADARGGSGGTNLIRAQIVLSDQNGDLIGRVLKEGREGMPKFDLPADQVQAIAAFIHSFPVGGYDLSRMTPETIVTGDPKAGEAYFARTCAGCHSVDKDLKGIGARITDAKILQQTWLMPGPRGGFGPPSRGPVTRAFPVMVAVTQADGRKFEGRLVRVDDFIVTLAEPDGYERTFTRQGDSPKVDIKDPLAPHRALLPKYEDKNIHDVTAYLVTVK